MSVHTYKTSYRTMDGGCVFINIDDDIANVGISFAGQFTEVGVDKNDLFQLAGLFNRAFGHASQSETEMK